MPRRLPQYLRYERRRAGYAQADVAYLLGARARTKVARYERSRHLPPLPVALAYEAMFGVAVAELFPTAFATARAKLRRRARRKLNELVRLPETARNLRRQRSLEDLLASQ
jgi:transcriptional regulator with XRE-family HTH domain